MAQGVLALGSHTACLEGDVVWTWRPRHFTLDVSVPRQPVLLYARPNGEPPVSAELAGAALQEDRLDTRFRVDFADGRTYLLAATSVPECRAWVGALRQAIACAGGVAAASEEASRAAGALKSLTPIAAYWTASASGRSQGGSPSGAWSFAGALPGGLLNGAAPHSSSPACLPDRRRGEYDVSAVAAAAYEASLPCLHPPLGEARQRFAARRSMASGSGTLRSVPSSLESESSSGSLDRARSSRSAGSLPEPSPSSLAPLHSSPSMAVLGDGALAALPPPMAAASLEEQYERAHQYVQRHSGALPAEHRDVLESWYRAVEAGRGVAMAGAWEGWDAGVAGALPAPQHSPTPPCTPAFTPQASFVSGGAKRELPALGVSGSLQTSSQQSPIAAMAMFVLTLTRLVPDWASWGVQHSLYVSPEVMIAALRRRPWSSTLGDVAECAAFASPAWLRLFLAMGGADLLLQALVLHAQRAWGEGRRAQSRRLERERRRGEGQAAAEQLPSPLKPPPAGTLLRASSASAASAHRLAGQAAWEAWAQGAAAPLPPPPEGQSPVAKDGAQSRLAQSPLSACQGPPSYSLGPSPPPSPAQATEPPPSLRRGANSPAEPLEASDTRAAARQCAIVALQALHSLVSSGGGMAACMAHSDFLPAVCLALGRRDSLAAQLADQLLAEVCVYSPLGYAGTVRFLLGRRQDPAGVGTQASTASEVEIDGRRDVKRSLSLPAPARRPLSPCEAPEAFSFAQAVVHKGSEQEALSAASPTHPPLLAETSDPDPGSPASSSLAARSGSSVLFNLPCGTFVEHFPAEEALPAAPRAYPPLHSIAAPGTLSDLGPAQLPRSFRRDLLTELLAHLCPSSALGEGGEERELDVDLVEHTLRLLSILCRPLPTSFFAEQKLGEEGGEEEEGAGRTRGTEGTERARGTEGTERAPSRAEGGLASRPLTPSLHLPASLSASARAPTPCPHGPVHRPAALSLQVELVRALVARGLFRVLADLRDFGNAFLNAEVDVLKHAVHSVLQAEVQRDKAARRERERRLREASEEETKPAPPPPPPPPPAVAPAPKTPAKSAVKPGPPPPPPPPPPGRGAQPGRPPGPPPPPPPPGSGPRPPPPPPRGGPAPPQTDPGPCPRLKLRSLFWDRLPETRVQGTRWAAVKPAYDALDVPALEVAFAAAQRKSGSAASAVAAGPAQRLAVLDLKRATGIGIRCASLPLPASAIPDAAARLDACLVSCSSRLEALRACVPSADEASMLESFVRGDEARAANLAEAERLALRLGRLPRLEARLGALQALREAAGVLQDARAAARAHASAQRELAHGRVFAAALERVLALGNFLNHGSRLGAAPGFRLRILKKLGDTRSADGKTTLLTVLARQMNVFLDQEADKEGRLEAESFATVKEHLQGLTSPLLRVSLAEIEDTVQTLAVKLVAARAEVEAAAKELEDAGFGAEDPGQGEKGVGEAAGRPVQAVQAVRPSAAKQSVSVSSPTSTLEEERSGGTGSLAGAQPGIPVPQPLAPAPPQPAPAAPLALPAAASTRLLAAEAFVRRAGPRLSQVQAELEEVQATLSAVQAGFAEMAAAFGEPGGAGVSEQELLGGLQDWALALVAAQRHARAEDAAARAGPRLANQAASMVRAAFARKRAGKGGGKVDQSAAGGTETAGEHASLARSSIAVDAR